MDPVIIVAVIALAGPLGTQALLQRREQQRVAEEDRRLAKQRNNFLLDELQGLLDEAAIALREANFQFENIGNTIVWIQDRRITYTIEGIEGEARPQEAAIEESRALQKRLTEIWRLETRVILRLPDDHDAVVALKEAAEGYTDAIRTIAEWSAGRVTGDVVTEKLLVTRAGADDAEARFQAACRDVVAPTLPEVNGR